MINGILWAVGAGIMLGLYALPEKYIKGYKYENTWFLFFFLSLIVLPVLSSFLLIDNFCDVLMTLPSKVLCFMIFTSFLWGVGVQLWSKAIDYIGVSLGFSIFIGSVILVGSILPFIVDGLPSENALWYIIMGLIIILIGVVSNGRAGILRKESSEHVDSIELLSSGKTIRGIFIALIGGLLATGFSIANAVGNKPITEAVIAQGNPMWMSSIAIMFIIYLSGALYAIPYFVFKLFKNNTWSTYKSKHSLSNFGMAFIMACLNYAASASFAYAAFSLGSSGNTVGYAIYNTVSVLLAVIGGLLTKEWVGAPKKVKRILYFALISMLLGVVLIAIGNAID